MKRYTCSATFTFPLPEPFLGCGMGTTPGVITSIGPNLYWDISSNVPNVPFTNSLAFPIQVGDVICVDGSSDISSPPIACNISSQFFIDGIPITSPFPACPPGGVPVDLLQYLATTYTINNNATITVTSNGSNLIVVVEIEDNIARSLVELVVSLDDIPIIFFSSSLICRNRRKRKSGFMPSNCTIKDGRIICMPHIRNNVGYVK